MWGEVSQLQHSWGLDSKPIRERAFLFQPSTFNLYNYDDDVQNHDDACDDADGDAEHPNDELQHPIIAPLGPKFLKAGNGVADDCWTNT